MVKPVHHRVGRNDPCPCGSGKKYKKCCELKTTHKKFSAQLLVGNIEQAGEVKKVQKLSSLFQKAVPSPTPKAPESEEPPNIVM